MTEPPYITIWKDTEGDRITVTWEATPGYYVKTDHPDIMARVDATGRVTGFQADAFSRLPQEPVAATPVD